MEYITVEERMKRFAKRYNHLDTGRGKTIWEDLISILEAFLSGDVFTAYSDFYTLFCDNISKMRLFTIKSGANLYRMRSGSSAKVEYVSEYEMGHIPFELNHLVGNERFSMSGLPSLYLASSIYACWEEIHRPHFEYTSCALFKAKGDIKVIDLTAQKYYKFNDEIFSDCLTLACSFIVEHPDAPFKPEYVIPQLLLQSLVRYLRENKECTTYGIKYTSTHINDPYLWINFPKSNKKLKLFYNYVFPAFDRQESGVSKNINNLFEFWNSMTYNKVKLMEPDFKVEKPRNKYQKSMFGLMEERLNLCRGDMLLYDI